MNNSLIRTPQSIVVDIKNLVRNIFIFLGFEKLIHKNLPFSLKDRKKLISTSRYISLKILLFDRIFQISDSMTFLSGFKDIFKKEPYKFSFDANYPWIIDCGANIGLSVIYFKRNYPDAKIIAIEPDPKLFDILRKNLDSFGYNDVVLIQKALWYENCCVKFKQEGGFSGQVLKDTVIADVVNVETISLDGLLKDIKVGFLKIDIEGAENEIFSLSSPNLFNVSNIFIEYHSREGDSQKLQNILSNLSDQEFRYHIHHEFINPTPFLNRIDLIGMDLQLNIYGYRK